MAKINGEILLRGDHLLLQKCSTELDNLALPNHLQVSSSLCQLLDPPLLAI